MELLSLFSDKLGFERDFFTRAHDPRVVDLPEHAAAHTDFVCLTPLFQCGGQGGLQVCPGKERDAQQWTSVHLSEDAITCNIGDMLMRWSDDLLPSNFHRVRSPDRPTIEAPATASPSSHRPTVT